MPRPSAPRRLRTPRVVGLVSSSAWSSSGSTSVSASSWLRSTFSPVSWVDGSAGAVFDGFLGGGLDVEQRAALGDLGPRRGGGTRRRGSSFGLRLLGGVRRLVLVGLVLLGLDVGVGVVLAAVDGLARVGGRWFGRLVGAVVATDVEQRAAAESFVGGGRLLVGLFRRLGRLRLGLVVRGVAGVSARSPSQRRSRRRRRTGNRRSPRRPSALRLLRGVVSPSRPRRTASSHRTPSPPGRRPRCR